MERSQGCDCGLSAESIGVLGRHVLQNLNSRFGQMNRIGSKFADGKGRHLGDRWFVAEGSD